MQKYKEINGNDYVKDSRTTINETMQSIQSMNSGTAFPTNNLFEGMKCYRTDLKKTYTLTDAENGTWVEDAHASLSDEATHAASATRLQTPRALNLSGAVTADAANFDGTADATINVKTLDASKLKGTTSVSTTGNAATATKLAAARTIALSGNASGSTTFDGSGNATINATVNESAHAATATKVVTTAADGASANIAEATMASNDLARIRVSGTTNAGELALETAYDGSEPIVARQYTGIYTTPIRTAKILDESGNTSFPGTVVAPKFTGSLNGNAATASKLSTARKINITGNATGAATFDGTSDANINVSVSQAAHADKATQDTNGRAFTDTNAYMHISALADNTDFNNVKTTGIYYCTDGTYPNRPYGSWGILTVYSIGTVKQEYRPDNAAVYYTREYNTANWTAWSKVNAANADTATKLATPRAISLTGNASGSATFDGSGNVSINTTVNESKHAAAANNDGNGANIASTYVKKAGDTTTGKITFASTDLNALPEVKKTSDDNMSGVRFSSKTKFLGAVGKRLSNGEDLLNLRSDNNTTDVVLDSRNYNNYAPTKTGGGASGTWGISITGNANTASTASSVAWSGVTGKPGTYPPSAHNHDSAYPSVTGARASGTWGINISGNADSATNADKVDGYHVSDIINRISAANTGGIVAASLTENGYVKFANGLILQWGKKSDDYFVFPIAFAKVYGAWSICTSNDWARINELTTSRVKSSQNNGFVFAIGI